ncbi:ABC transporter ATP-binding protein [Bacillus sp. HMF5848]|uniref:ABC transporter ATP-binding protein n=1 Tax=Bacillus sp. HMF5848 TaxID=2495421 RepID=UPI000F7A1F27|nr:ABC transporter ATP-binding protein [Bacillus sp. HMF5848]RSK27976.1 ABC transporter ATP-binding protein [Bacillus sp. HMF5848]
MEPIAQIKNVTKQIGKKRIIDDITFDIYPGEVFGFLGPNGAGKTTTIRMMVGLMGITSGEILIKGHSIRTDFEKAISQVGGIVENPEMYKFLTGYQNLVHYARMYVSVDKNRIDEVIELVGLDKRIHDKVKTYSLGMRQRLGLAQALLHNPALLILDEPTNGLDPAGIREFRDYLRKLAREENLSVLVSSHLLSEMEMMCDRIGIIQNGKLVDVKTLNELVKSDKDTSVYRIATDNKEFASKVVSEQFTDLVFTQMDDTLLLTASKETIAQIVAELVKANVKIYEVSQTTPSLEDKFLEITGGNQIV